MRMYVTVAAIALLAFFACPRIASAQDSAELLTRLKEMEARIKSLEAEVQVLKGQPPPPTAAVAQPPVTPPTVAPEPAAVAPAQAAAAEPASVQLGGAGGASAKALNPDIAVIGDFLGAVGNGANRSTPSLEMHESELAIQAILDPYARADFFISFGEQGVNLEEGFITFPALKGGLQLRVGKMRAAFGKVNTLHNHVLPWTDRPLVTQDLVGGEDGINDAGIAVSRIFSGPKQIFLEGTAQIFRGDSDDLFHASRRSEVSTVEHLRGYRDLSESTNLDLGVSYSRGHSALVSNAVNQLYGIDATLRWKPLRRSIYHSFLSRNEFIWSRIHQPGSTVTPFGYYVSGDYQVARRWFAGGRFDRSERFNNIAFNLLPGGSPLNSLQLLQDTGGSLVLTYWPSEFSQIRAQLRRTRYGETLTANELLFQFQFSIGAHGAHPF